MLSMKDSFMKPLFGIHHVTAMTSSAERIYAFFTYTLGMRLVKKTINQDDIQTYHLFFADDQGSPGTDMTFFDFPNQRKAIKGSDEIAKTGFRVPNDEALTYWLKRFDHYKVNHSPIKTLFGIQYIDFIDFDGQEYALFSDEHDRGVAPGIPWHSGPVPDEFAIRGLGPIFFRVSNPDSMGKVLTDILTFTKTGQEGNITQYQTGLGGNGATVYLINAMLLPKAQQGFGGVHHVAFGVDDTNDIQSWIAELDRLHAGHSGFVDRFYFKSLYTRLYPGILFEFATKGPGFIDDEEPYETLGESLALPPRFRQQRQTIERLVRPIDTVRSTLSIQKEFFSIL